MPNKAYNFQQPYATPTPKVHCAYYISILGGRWVVVGTDGDGARADSRPGPSDYFLVLPVEYAGDAYRVYLNLCAGFTKEMGVPVRSTPVAFSSGARVRPGRHV